MLLENRSWLCRNSSDCFGRRHSTIKSAVHYVQGKAVDDFTEIPRDRLEKTFLVNIVGMISLAQKALPHMKPGSAIINVRWNFNMLPYGISCLHACLWVSIQ